jgi:hypothetical protein
MNRFGLGLLGLLIVSGAFGAETVTAKYGNTTWAVPVRNGYLPEIDWRWDGQCWAPVYVWSNKYPAAAPYVVNGIIKYGPDKGTASKPTVSEIRTTGQPEVKKSSSITDAIPDRRKP